MSNENITFDSHRVVSRDGSKVITETIFLSRFPPAHPLVAPGLTQPIEGWGEEPATFVAVTWYSYKTDKYEYEIIVDSDGFLPGKWAAPLMHALYLGAERGITSVRLNFDGEEATWLPMPTTKPLSGDSFVWDKGDSLRDQKSADAITKVLRDAGCSVRYGPDFVPDRPEYSLEGYTITYDANDKGYTRAQMSNLVPILEAYGASVRIREDFVYADDQSQEVS